MASKYTNLQIKTFLLYLLAQGDNPNVTGSAKALSVPSRTMQRIWRRYQDGEYRDIVPKESELETFRDGDWRNAKRELAHKSTEVARKLVDKIHREIDNDGSPNDIKALALSYAIILDKSAHVRGESMGKVEVAHDHKHKVQVNVSLPPVGEYRLRDGAIEHNQELPAGESTVEPDNE